MEFTYVCSLIGTDVFHGHSIVGCISNISDVDKVLEKIKAKHGIEFEQLVTMSNNDAYLCFINITDERDVYLVIERTYFI